MLPKSLAFVDIETTGLRARNDRIIEIGIIRFEENRITQTYHSLINPQTPLPQEITTITGITENDLSDAPVFGEVISHIREVLADTIFVAHNVEFDYYFLKEEFARQKLPFILSSVCTVRLSRTLYPTLPRHNLETLIQTFNIPYEKRHRALDDAKALYYLYNKMRAEIQEEKLVNALRKHTKHPQTKF